MKATAATTRAQSDAFHFMRFQIGEQVNAHLKEMAGLNLDDYLTKVALGESVETEWRFVDGAFRSVERQKDSVEVAQDIRVLKTMAHHFGWPDAKLTLKVKEYFEGSPEDAVTVLKRLHEVFDPGVGRRITVRFKDADGNEQVRYIETTKWQSVRSAGILAFKGALKGWKIWGDAASGRDLYLSIAKIYGDESLTTQQIAAAQAKALSAMIEVAEYAELVKYYGASNLSMNIPLGSTLSQAALLSDGGYLQEDKQIQLTLTFIKDLSRRGRAQLAVANALWGMSTWGYDKYALSSAKASIIDFLVENGVWKIERIPLLDADGKPIWDEQGVAITIADQSKLPELEKVRYTTDGETIRSVSPVEVLRTDADGKKKMTVRQIAKLLDRAEYPDGVKLMKRRHADRSPEGAARNRLPGWGRLHREAPHAPGHRGCRAAADPGSVLQGAHLLYQHQGLDRGMARPDGARQGPHQGGCAGYHEDARHRLGAEPWRRAGAAQPQPHAILDRDRLRRDLGRLGAPRGAQELRVPRLGLLGAPAEDPRARHRPTLIDEASRRVLEQDILDQDALSYLEIKEMDKRLKQLDERVWGQIAPSARPFPVDPPYDREVNIPITERFRRETQEQRSTITDIITWLKKWKDVPEEDRDFFTITTYTSDPGEPMGMVTEGLDEAGVRRRARQLLQQMTKLMFKFEEDYDKILKQFSGADKYAGQGDGTPIFTITPYHVRLNPAQGRVADAKTAKTWDKGYRAEYARVEQDVGNILNVRGWNNLVGIAGVEEFLGDFTGTGFEFYAAASHPYWKRLLRLRFQIHKLQAALSNVADVDQEELKKLFGNRMLLDDKAVSVDHPLTAAGGAAGDEEEDAETLDPSNPEVFIRGVIELMEAEYKKLLDLLLNLFDIEVEVEPVAPASSLQVWTVMKATATLGQKKDDDGNPVLPRIGGFDPDNLQSVVTEYVWKLYGKDMRLLYEKTTQEPTVKMPILEGDMVTLPAQGGAPATKARALLLRVYAVGGGANRIPLGETAKPFPVGPGRFRGKLIIHGDWPGFGGIPIEILADGMPLCAIDPPSEGTDLEVKIDTEVIKAPRLLQSNFDDLDNKFYVPFQASAVVPVEPWQLADLAPLQEDLPVPAQSHPGDFIVDANEVLELFYPYLVTVDVDVHDASDTEVEADVTVRAGGETKTVPPYVFGLQRDDQVRVKAERKQPLPVSETGGPESFDPDDGKTMSFEIMLPFFKSGNLTVTGVFAPAIGIDPPVTLRAGTARPSFGDEFAVGSSEEFRFINNRDIYLKDSLTLHDPVRHGQPDVPSRRGSLYEEAQRSPIFDAGPVTFEPYELLIKPIRIKVVDLADTPIPSDQVTVGIGTDATTWQEPFFVGSWLFKKKDEQVTLEAKMTLPDGRPVSATHTMSINDFDLLGTPTPPDPIDLQLPVFLTLDVKGQTQVEVPDGEPRPLKVKLTNAPLHVNAFADADQSFTVTVPVPVKLGDTVTLDALAKKGNFEYRGSGSAPVQVEPLQLGTIVLKPKKQKDFVTIQDLAVSASGGGQPIIGKPITATATVSTGEYDGPLSIEWKRLSDGASKIDPRIAAQGAVIGAE